LGCKTETTAYEYVAVRFPGDLVLGLAVDAIQKIGTLSEGTEVDLPIWQSERKLIEKVIIRDDTTQVFSIDLAALYNAQDLCAIASLSEQEAVEKPKVPARSRELQNIIYEDTRYLVVEAGNNVAIPLSQVNRIIERSGKITKTQHPSHGFQGYFAKEKESIALFDLTTCLGGTEAIEQDTKVLLTGTASQQTGFQVAKVVGIEVSEWREKQNETDPNAAPPLVQLGTGENASVLPICDLDQQRALLGAIPT
jgi:chemotaxis signal transduction protein